MDPSKASYTGHIVESPARRWLQLWRSGQAGSVREFLAGSTLSREDQVAVLLVEQRERWQLGERVATEAYFSWFPELAVDAEAAVELIYGEFLLRKHLGERPAAEEFLERFPAQADWLSKQFELHQALQSSSRNAEGETVSFIKRDTDVETTPFVPDAGSSYPLRSIGRYQIQSLLGKGGMGVAFKAWDPQLKRVVVLKTLRGAGDADEAELARFRAEAAAIAQIRHANIVQVFDVGEYAGRPYFAMEFCEGGSLAEKLQGEPLPPREAAEMVEQIAEGISAAHAADIIHRDLKPANVLLGTGNTPKVADFGLAKKLDAQDDQTRTGAIMGTPTYMAPEQAYGESKRVGPAADLYALGVLLYECLTGRPPFKGTTLAETLDQVRHREPLGVRQLQPKTPADLETIALKCLQKDPARRYASAESLVADLRRFLEGRPILARPVGRPERTWRWCRRNPAVASLLTAVFLVLVVGIAGTTAMWLQARWERDEARANMQMATNALHASFMQIQHEQLIFLPGMTNLRRNLMLTALPFYKQLVAKSGDQPGYRRDLALAYIGLAGIEQHAGSTKKALSYWEDAIAHLTDLAEDAPDNDDYAYHLASCFRERGRLLHQQGRNDEARKELTEAAERFSVMQRPVEKIGLIIMYEGFSWQDLGEVAIELGDAEEGERLLRRGAEAMQKLMQINSHDPYFNCQVAECRAVLGQQLLKTNRPEAALVELEAARDLMVSAVEKPFHQQAIGRFYLTKTLSLLGTAYQKLDRTQEAEQALLAAHELLAQFARGSPTVKDYRRDLAECEHSLARLCLSEKRNDEAETWCRQSLARWETLIQDFPDDSGMAQKLARSQALLKDLIAR